MVRSWVSQYMFPYAPKTLIWVLIKIFEAGNMVFFLFPVVVYNVHNLVFYDVICS